MTLMVYLKNDVFIEERRWGDKKIDNYYHTRKAYYIENGIKSSLNTIPCLILIMYYTMYSTSTGQEEIEAESSQLTCSTSHVPSL